MSFDSLLDTTCTIQERLDSGTTDIAGHVIYTWPDVVTDWPVRVDDKDQNQFARIFTLDGKQVRATNIIFMREPTGITLDRINELDFRIEWQDKMYRLLHAKQLDGYGDKHHLEIEAIHIEKR